MAMKRYLIHNVQLQSMERGESIVASGGRFVVVYTGTARRAPIYDPDNGYLPMTQPITMTRGRMRFATLKDDSEIMVDVYGHAPGGQWAIGRKVRPGDPTELYVDTNKLDQVMTIPFAVQDFAPNVDHNTGFLEPAGAVFLPFPWVRVVTQEANRTLTVGTSTAEGGVAAGFIDGISLASAGAVAALILNGANTMGSLFERQVDGTASNINAMPHVSGGRTITARFSANTANAAAFIHLPYHLSA